MNSFVVAWTHRGEDVTLPFMHLTAQKKNAFANWLKPQLLADARTWMPVNEYEDYRDSLVEPQREKAFWNAIPSPPIARALGTREGSIQLNRILCEGLKGWTDDEVWELLQAKDADPESDYRIVFDLIWNEAHPKALAAATSPTPPPDTGADPAALIASSAS